MLGSGTSSGVPTIGCGCPTCQSDDPRDKRLRPSILVESATTRILVDTSSDFRQQCIRWDINRLDAVIYTHHHFDHIAGFDDLRAFNFTSRKPVPIYLMQETLDNMERIFEYAFDPSKRLQSSAPIVDAHVIGDDPFVVGDIECLPIPLLHGLMRVNGYRFNSFAYCTDCNRITDLGYDRLRGVEYVILDALRHRPHPTHFTVDEALAEVKRISARKTWFTHIAHDLKHADVSPTLPHGVELGYDGLKFDIDNGDGSVTSGRLVEKKTGGPG